jgi:hypothetical protein
MSSEPERRILGRVLFVDDATRDVYEVYENADGVQWVAAHDGSTSKIGQIVADEPLLVDPGIGPGIPSYQECQDSHFLLNL